MIDTRFTNWNQIRMIQKKKKKLLHRFYSRIDSILRLLVLLHLRKHRREVQIFLFVFENWSFVQMEHKNRRDPWNVQWIFFHTTFRLIFKMNHCWTCGMSIDFDIVKRFRKCSVWLESTWKRKMVTNKKKQRSVKEFILLTDHVQNLVNRHCLQSRF